MTGSTHPAPGPNRHRRLPALVLTLLAVLLLAAVAVPVLNAAADHFSPAAGPAPAYPGARPRDARTLHERADGTYRTHADLTPGQTVSLALTGIRPDRIPTRARPAAPALTADAAPDELAGVVYADTAQGDPGQVDPTETGLPGVTVEAVRDGRVIARAHTAADGSFHLGGLHPGHYALQLPGLNAR